MQIGHGAAERTNGVHDRVRVVPSTHRDEASLGNANVNTGHLHPVWKHIFAMFKESEKNVPVYML